MVQICANMSNFRTLVDVFIHVRSSLNQTRVNSKDLIGSNQSVDIPLSHQRVDMAGGNVSCPYSSLTTFHEEYSVSNGFVYFLRIVIFNTLPKLIISYYLKYAFSGSSILCV